MARHMTVSEAVSIMKSKQALPVYLRQRSGNEVYSVVRFKPMRVRKLLTQKVAVKTGRRISWEEVRREWAEDPERWDELYREEARKADRVFRAQGDRQSRWENNP